MNTSAAGFDYDRYRKLLAEASDEPKRLALIQLLIEEKAKDRLAGADLPLQDVSDLGSDLLRKRIA
jgi:hypothetical protein